MTALPAKAASEAEFGKLAKTYTLHKDGSQEMRVYKELTLFTHAAMNGLYGESFIVYNPAPGGGFEGDEDAFECAVRECAEECGLIVKPVKPLFNIREYYRDCIFFSAYVLCEIVGECEKHFTEKEKSINIISDWRDMGDVLSDIEDLMKRYKDIDGELYGCHKREYIAIKELIDSRI